MNTLKHLEFFNPDEAIDCEIHVIGVGAIGSTLVENLVRLGISTIHIYDFDIVSETNIANQMFFDFQVGKEKEDAIIETVIGINPNVNIIKHGKWIDQQLSGYVFLCVDSIEIRKQIVLSNKYNLSIKAFFDVRMRLTDAQHYACTIANVDYFYKTMNFTAAEACEGTVVSACGTTLNVVYIVRCIVSLVVANFVRFLRTNKLYKLILADTNNFDFQYYEE